MFEMHASICAFLEVAVVFKCVCLSSHVGRTDGRRDGWMDGQMDGQTDPDPRLGLEFSHCLRGFILIRLQIPFFFILYLITDHILF